MDRMYVTFSTETLSDHFAETVTPPPRRFERYSENGIKLPTAIDVYMDTKVRPLGLWVQDDGFKYFAVKPRRLPAGVADNERRYVAHNGVMIGPPHWVSKEHHHVLTVERARIDAKRLLALIPTLEPCYGVLDPDGLLVLDYNPPRVPRRRRGDPVSQCPTCGHAR